LFSKPLEFEGFKIGIIEAFPYSQILQCISVSQPIGYDRCGVIGFETGNVGKGDIIIIVILDDGYIGVFYGNFSHGASIFLC
jgi:hypothetical protein